MSQKMVKRSMQARIMTRTQAWLTRSPKFIRRRRAATNLRKWQDARLRTSWSTSLIHTRTDSSRNKLFTRSSSLNIENRLIFRGGNRIKFDNFSGRYKKAGNKADFSTPSYNPNFDLVRKSTTSGILNFAKIAGRKDQEHEYYCKN